jgi:TonB-dependent receptor
MLKFLYKRYFLLLTIISFLLINITFAQQEGRILGKITDASTGDPLPGANVILENTGFGAASDRKGEFTISAVKPGDYKIKISYLGYGTYEENLSVEPGKRTELKVSLSYNAVQTGEVLIESIRLGQSLALNQQKTADNIKNVVASDLIGRFPDPTVADALQRLPAISVQRDQGDGRYIQIRGTNPNLSNISVNGEQIPSPEGDVRFVALDMISSDVLSGIEVNKAITPDMDGDAIGGSVNLNTLNLTGDNQVLKVTLGSGYNMLVKDLSPFNGQGSLVYGNRLGENKDFGFMLGANYNVTNRASDDNEMSYDDGELEELELRDYELTRKRAGVTAAFDYRFSPTSKIYLTGLYNFFSDQEYRRLLGVETDALSRELKDRLEEQQIVSVSGGGVHSLGSLMELDYMLSYSYADQYTPFDRSIAFQQEYEDEEGESIDFMEFNTSNSDYPQFNTSADAPEGAGAYNYSSFEFDEFGNSSEITTDRHFTSRLNLKTFYNLGDIRGELKFGGLYRTKSKDRNLDARIYDYDGDLTYAELQGSFLDDDFLSGEYPNGVGYLPDPEKVESFYNNNKSSFELEEDDSFEESELSRYRAGEDTYAGYLMTKLKKGAFSTVIGARYENINVNYKGNVIEYDEEGELLPLVKKESEKTFDFFLPMIHLKYELNDKTNLRFAWTNTFSKPNYYDLVPYRIIVREDEELELGNPDLKPTKSMNFDLMCEYYFSSIGIISAGVFYKSIDDFIYTRSYEFTAEEAYNGYIATQPVNGSDAKLAGFEVNLQQQLTFLPGVLSGLGIYANYTYTWSEAEVNASEDADDIRKVTLPGQTENVGNFALSYEAGGFSGRISLNYAGAFIDEIRDKEGNDRMYDERFQLDISASQKLTNKLRLFVEFINLTNAPLRYYNGVTSRPEQQEFYSSWSNFGLKYEL